MTPLKSFAYLWLSCFIPAALGSSAKLWNHPRRIGDCIKGCLNDGTKSYLLQYINKPCHCTGDYTGRCCEAPICYNNGYAFYDDAIEETRCGCPKEFTGTHCENKRSCETDARYGTFLCFFGGRPVGKSKCACKGVGREGACCEILNCGSNGRVETAEHGSESCDCKPGYSGEFCEHISGQGSSSDQGQIPTWGWVIILLVTVLGSNCLIYAACLSGCYLCALYERSRRLKVVTRDQFGYRMTELNGYSTSEIRADSNENALTLRPYSIALPDVVGYCCASAIDQYDANKYGEIVEDDESIDRNDIPRVEWRKTEV